MYRYAVRNLGVDDLVIAVNPRHEWAYKQLLLFDTISRGVRSYRYVKGAPAIAMRLDLRTCVERWRRTYGAAPPERNLYRIFMGDDPFIELPPPGGPHNVWDERLFEHFFARTAKTRRRVPGSLADLYLNLTASPELGVDDGSPERPGLGAIDTAGTATAARPADRAGSPPVEASIDSTADRPVAAASCAWS
jgi:hypothetical protein